MTRSRSGRATGPWLALALAFALPSPLEAGEFVVRPTRIVETKAVFGRVEPRDLVPARARIGGTLLSLDVDEGSAVRAGQVLAVVADEKLALQMQAIDARLRALRAEVANAETDLARARQLVKTGATPRQRVDQLQTQVDVGRNQIAATEAERSVIAQQTAEGQVVAPADGRVIAVPVTKGAVVMPGEPVAQIAAGGYFLRLALPERHAPLLREGAAVSISRRGAGEPDGAASGRLAKVYPEIENGRVIADVEVEALGDYFVGERTLVGVPVAERTVLAVPPQAVRTHSGIDFVRIVEDEATRDVAVIVGPVVETADGPRVEVLSGLRDGDRVVTP